MTFRNLRKSARTAAVTLAAAMAATAFTVPAQASPITGHGATGHEATRRAIDAEVRAGIPGITAQVRDARGVWRATSGVGDRTSGAPRGENDRYRVGSITKTFVATVLLQLEAEGRLDLDDTVEHHLPGLVRGNGNDGNRITVRHLLSHTSGLFDYLADEEYVATYLRGEGYLKHRYDTLPPLKHVKVALSHPPLFTPGKEFSYSNTNYILAGLILEKAGKRSYEAQVRERIIKPLGLRATTNPGNSIRIPQPSSRAYSKLFDAQPDRIDDVTEMNGSQGWADGDIISTNGDLNRFYRALMHGRLLPPQQLKAMKTTGPSTGRAGMEYGLGLMKIRTSCGTTLWGHGGGMVGSTSLAVTTEDGRHQLAYNRNGDWNTGAPNAIAEAEFCPPKAQRSH
ncbi:D-alanyl-D-alanine carboxypeptidase [Streptomyces spiroverticillatus]|uniref:D-alanyl-D-alanine carboxypeptidase n=1 Tax=Streptomyces finlayi TaxID=67296 RepID=A0A918X634_9ACTN|nr:serine hydrolase domain-containing protein [Streptomyces finlayi]GHA30247.1 D-alanyl-D-alanine carboxypeptidase [Streptomyces spiroverticillatus]GHD14986.1 D-alanyl-D-alanine carboxypeptidase [Streptomyces finlayi]